MCCLGIFGTLCCRCLTLTLTLTLKMHFIDNAGEKEKIDAKVVYSTMQILIISLPCLGCRVYLFPITKMHEDIIPKKV